MRKLVYVLFFISISSVVFGQTIPEKVQRINETDTFDSLTQDSIAVRDIGQKQKKSVSNQLDAESSKVKKAKIQDYLIISKDRDTTFVDTSLTIRKDYKFNYLRKDNFGLIPFSNLGQTYNSLTHNFQNTNSMPQFGARARHFNYMEIEDINYYRVPTPLTELFYRTAFEQGQLADSFFTVNTSPQFNFSIAYKGMRSIGNYQHMITSTGNFRFTSNYTSKNKRYQARAHFVTQDLFGEENGGLQEDSVENFETGEDEFLERPILDVNFENADNILIGKRFYLDQSYNIFNKVVEKYLPQTLNDSISKSRLDLKHVMSFEDKYYQYNQTSVNTSFFGEAFNNQNLFDKTTVENFYNELQLDFYNNVLGNIQINLNNTNYNYGYNKLVVLNGNTIVNRLKGSVFAVGGKYSKQYKGFSLNGELGVNISGDFEGNYFKVNTVFNINEDISASASINHSSKAPNYNTLLYQSDYISYNWQNNFNNIETQQISFKLKYKELANITVDYSTINDYVYFKQDEATLQVSPFQNDKTITYLRAKFENEIKFGKFAINNTIMYQNVQDHNNVLNVPKINTRNTLYFSSHLFKKALFLQTGVTLNYFSKYYMDAYSPLLAEFYVQNDREFGDFPRLDYFLNAKIRQTRIYFKVEHFNSSFTGYNYYAAPTYPYRDLAIRFGVVWNFFL
ncbi:MAG: putative porin [Algibacter sp.]|uniref:putative porin n=1 Tax=Algibacter sp. TaxID=1872428 RepID=UPI00260375F0|nr:putative porin [Algibacter sp.]MDG1730641.1 putative porin [Algibacter sp.]MDG2177592.1 putative porin [Algibacter sp.]